MVQERCSGIMAENIRAIIKTIRSMVMECSNGLMEESISETGRMVSYMAGANTFRWTGKGRLANG
jgi:hypothetical protein